MQRSDEPNSNNMIRLQDIDVSKITFSDLKKAGKISFTNLYYNGDSFQIKMDEKLSLMNASAPSDDNPKYVVKFRTNNKEYIQKMYDIENALHEKFPGKQYNSMFGKDFWTGDKTLPMSVDFNFKFKESENDERQFSRVDFLDENGIIDESVTVETFKEGIFKKGTTGNVIFEVAGYEGAGNMGIFFRPQYIKTFSADEVAVDQLFSAPTTNVKSNLSGDGNRNKRPRLDDE
jgi:hypothetical protein